MNLLSYQEYYIVSRIIRAEGGHIMIDFMEELMKYKPIMGVDDIEAKIQRDELKVIMDLLQHITRQIAAREEEE